MRIPSKSNLKKDIYTGELFALKFRVEDNADTILDFMTDILTSMRI